MSTSTAKRKNRGLALGKPAPKAKSAPVAPARAPKNARPKTIASKSKAKPATVEVPAAKKGASTKVKPANVAVPSARKSAPAKPKPVATVTKPTAKAIAPTAKDKAAATKPKSTMKSLRVPKQLALTLPGKAKGSPRPAGSNDPNQPKAKRARVPKDLASQYGEHVKERKPSKAAERKARRDAEERARMRAMMAPSDALIARLAKLGAIKVEGTESELSIAEIEDTDENVRPVIKRRPRKWDVLCGFCGTTSTQMGAAGLCTRCGAILVRETLGTEK